MPDVLAKCCMCGKDIHADQLYYKCSVSACNIGRLKLVFCSPACWNAHLPTARHRKASYTEHAAKPGEL